MPLNNETAGSIKRGYFAKLCLIISFCLLSFALLMMAQVPPANGYELSIYDAFPPQVWILITISVCIGISLLTLYPLHKCDSVIKYAIIIIVLNSCIALLLPAIRGYFLAYDPNWDVLHHIGEAKQISNSGHFSNNDWYPLIHIFITILRYFDISYENIVLLLSSFYSIIFFLFALLLVKCITKSNYEKLLVISCATPLFFQNYHMVLMPFYCSLWTIPIILYTMHMVRQSQQKYKFKILGIVLIFSIVFFHPLTTVIVVIILLTLMASDEIFSQIQSIKVVHEYPYFIIFISLVFFFWYIHNATFEWFTQDTYYKLLDLFTSNSAEIPSLVDIQVNSVISAGADPLLLIDRFIKIYGTIVTYTTINLLLILYIIKKLLVRKIVRKIQYFELVYSLLFLSGIIVMVLLLRGIVIGEIYRAACLLLIINPFLLGIGVYNYYNSIEKQKIAVLLLITAVVCSTAILGIFAIYPSPWYSGINQMTTFQEKDCLQWFSNTHDKDIGLVSEFLQTRCWNDYYYGTGNKEKKIVRSEFEIPTHFGYGNNLQFGELLDIKPVYMITNDRMKKYYYAVPDYRRNRLRQFNYDDFEKLNADRSVEKIYSTKGCETWLIPRL